MKILITGATGYVGQNIIPYLTNKYPDVQILTLNRNKEKAQKLFPYENCRHISTKEIKKIIQYEPDLIFHLAALSSSRDGNDMIGPLIRANIEYGARLLHVLSLCGKPQLFVNIGSFAEYRLGPQKMTAAYLYTASKSAFRHFVEYYSEHKDMRRIHVVLYSVYGGKVTSKKYLDHVIDSITAKQPVKMTQGEQILDFIHIEDISSFFGLLIKDHEKIAGKNNGEEFHVGTGRGTQLKEIVRIVERISGKKCNIEWGGLPYRSLDTMHSVAPIAKNIQKLQWRAQIPMEKGLRMVIDQVHKV